MAAVTVDRKRHITLRVTQEEAFEIQLLSANDQSVSAYLRRLVTQDKKRRSH